MLVWTLLATGILAEIEEKRKDSVFIANNLGKPDKFFLLSLIVLFYFYSAITVPNCSL
jgi:hypothetical protein